MIEGLKILPGTGRGTARRVVEGQALQASLHDEIHNGAQIGKHVASWNPQNVHGVASQPPIPILVPLRLVSAIVRLSVDLDRERGIETIEVEYIGAGGMLSAELDTCGTLAQFAPKKHFRQCHGLAKRARVSDGFSWSHQHCASPSTMLRMVPLPETSSGRIFS